MPAILAFIDRPWDKVSRICTIRLDFIDPLPGFPFCCKNSFSGWAIYHIRGFK